MIVNEFNSSKKIMKYLDKLDYFFNGSKTLIVTEFDLTNRCNNNCPNCTGNNQNNEELTWEQIKKIVTDLKQLGNQGIILSGGGEPLLHPNFIDTLRFIKETGMKIGLNSNGLALTSERAEAIARYCEYFRISLDAGSKEMYKQTHGMDEKAYNKVLENMQNMSNIIARMNSQISYGAGYLTGQDTISDMEKFVVLCKDTGLQFAQFRPFTGDTTDISKQYEELKEKYEDNQFKVRASLQKYNEFSSGCLRGYDKCRGMFFSTVITADAKVFACLHHRQVDKYLIGDINKKSLIDIWNSSQKWVVYENIDFSDCPYFCRNDSFNKTLNVLNLETIHSEFL